MQEGALTAWLNRKRLRVAKVTRKQLENIMRLVGGPLAEPGFW